MAFHPAYRTHTPPRRARRDFALAGLMVLAAHGVFLLLLLFSLAHQIVPPPEGPALVMADLPRQAATPVAPAMPMRVRVAAVTVTAPDFTVQPNERLAPLSASASTLATSMLASATATPSGGAPAAGIGSASGAGGGGGGFDINAYLARVAAHIQRYLRLPYLPSRSVQLSMPEVLVHLVWRRDGTVELAEVARSSDHSRVDDAAVAAVWRAQPLPPFPPELKGEHINGRIPVLFIYRYVRPMVQVAQPAPPVPSPPVQAIPVTGPLQSNE